MRAEEGACPNRESTADVIELLRRTSFSQGDGESRQEVSLLAGRGAASGVLRTATQVCKR